MEEYQSKVNYLRHIKNIADIQDGHRKPNALTTIFSQSHTKINQKGISSPKHTQSKCTVQLKTHTSTQRIMRNFTVEKQNYRLATKIISMNSCIPLKTYERDYQISKRYPVKEQKLKKAHNYFWFKFFDIKLGGTISDPENYYKIYALENKKKTLLIKDTLFDLRRKELRLKKKSEILLKIEGSQNEGFVKFQQNNLMEIMKHGHKVGHIVVQHLKK